MPEINSRSYIYNDPELKKNQAFQDLFNARRYDFSPNVYSSDFKRNTGNAIRAVANTLAKNEQGEKLSTQDKLHIDSILSAFTGKDLKDVSRNRETYMKVLTGGNLEKGFIQAFQDSWKTQDLSEQLSVMMNRYDDSLDPEEKARLYEDMLDIQAQMTTLGDYNERNGVGNLLVSSAPILNQSVKGLSYSINGALIGSALAAFAPAGLSTGLLSVGSMAGMGARIGSFANSYSQERGLWSWELLNMEDSDGNKIDDNTRKTIANWTGALIAAVEIISIPGLNNVLGGSLAETLKPIVRTYIGSVLKDTLSESAEEFFQDLIGYAATEIAKQISDSGGKTQFGKLSAEEYIKEGLSSALNSFVTSLGPSFVVSAISGGAEQLASGNLLRNLNYDNKIAPELTAKEIKAVYKNQEVNVDTDRAIPSSKILFKNTPSTEEILPNEDTNKYDVPTVRRDKKTNKYIGATQHDENILKTIYNKTGAKNIAVRIESEYSTIFTEEDLEKDIEGYGGIVEFGTENYILFPDNASLSAWLEDRQDDVTMNENGVEFVDENGVAHTATIESAESPNTNTELSAADIALNDSVQQTAQTVTNTETARPVSSELRNSIDTEDTEIINDLVRSRMSEILYNNEPKANQKKKLDKLVNATMSMLDVVERATGRSKLEMAGRIDFVVDTSESARSGYVENVTNSDGSTTYRIALNKKSSVKTVVHEMAHVLRQTLSSEELREFNRIYGGNERGIWLGDITETSDGKYKVGDSEFNSYEESLAFAVKNEEKFADDFVAYLRTQNAPNDTIKNVFNKLANLLREALPQFKTVLSDDVVSAFDNLLSRGITTISDAQRINATHRLYEQNRKPSKRAQSKVLLTSSEFKDAQSKGYMVSQENLMNAIHSDDSQTVRMAEEEIALRELMKGIPQNDVNILHETRNFEQVKQSIEMLSNVQEDDALYTAYEKLHSYFWAPTLDNQKKAFIDQFGTMEGLFTLQRALQRLVTMNTDGNGQVQRNSRPYNSQLFKNLMAITTSSSVGDANKVIKSFSRYPKAWLRLLYESGRTLSEYQNVPRAELEYYLNADTMSVADQISVEAVSSVSEPSASSSQDTGSINDIDKLKAENDAEDIADRTDTSYTDSEELSEDGKDLELIIQQQNLALQTAANKVADLTKTISLYENTIIALDEQLNKERQELKETIKQKTDEKISKIRESKNKLIDQLENDISHANSMLRQAKKEAASWQKSYERIKARLETANNRLSALKDRYRRQQLTRKLRKLYKFSSAQHDFTYLDPVKWMYSYMHGGNKLFNRYVELSDYEYEMLARLSGKETDENTVVLDPDKLFADSSENAIEAPNHAVMNLSMYRFVQSEIPAAIEEKLSAGTIQAIKTGMPFASLPTSMINELSDAMERTRDEAKASRQERINKRNSEYNKEASEIASAISSVFETVTDEVREAVVIDKYKPTDQQRNNSEYMKAMKGTITDEEAKKWMRQNPLHQAVGMGKLPEPSGLENFSTGYKLQFLKMFVVARYLDGKENGPIYKTFYSDMVDAENKYAYHKARRQTEFFERVLALFGGDKNKYRDFVNEENKKVSLVVNDKTSKTVEKKRWALVSFYNYAKNMTTFMKLVHSSGNNLTLETVASINPQSTLEMIEAELFKRDEYNKLEKQWEKDEFSKSPLFRISREELESVASRIRSGEITTMLSEKEIQFADLLVELLSNEQQRYAEAALQNDGVVISIVKDYFPAKANDKSVGDILSSLKKSSNVDNGSINDRNPYTVYPLSENPLKIFFSSIDNSERYINLGAPVKKLNRLLEHKMSGSGTVVGTNLGDIIANKFGEQYRKYLENYVSAVARRDEVMSVADRVMNRIIGNVARAKLMANLMTTVKQLVAIIPAITDGEINFGDFMNTALKFLNEDGRGEINQTIKEFGAVSINSSSRLEVQRYNEMFGQDKAGSKIRDIQDFLMTPIEATDKWVKKIVWYSAYAKSIEKKLSHDEAVRHANELILRTQNVGAPEALAPTQRYRNGLWRLIMVFTGDVFQQWNVLYGNAKLDFKNKKTIRRGIERSLGVFISLGLMAMAAGHILPDEDDEEGLDLKGFAHDFVGQLLGLIPLIGPAYLTDAFSGFSEDILTASALDVTEPFRLLDSDTEKDASDWLESIYTSLSAVGEVLISWPTVAIDRVLKMIFPDGILNGIDIKPSSVAWLFGSRIGEAFNE